MFTLHPDMFGTKGVISGLDGLDSEANSLDESYPGLSQIKILYTTFNVYYIKLAPGSHVTVRPNPSYTTSGTWMKLYHNAWPNA